MTTPQGVLFLFTAALAILGALGTVVSDKPLRAAMSLLLTVMSMAGLYLSLHAELLASLQMLVYAGAVVVLFVFVIMLIGPEGHVSTPTDRVLGSTLAAVFIGQVTIAVATFVGRATPWAPPIAAAGYGSVEQLGTSIYVDAALPFEAISVTLLLAILAAIAVARGRIAHEVTAVQRDREKRASLPPPPPVADEGEAS